MTFKNLTLINFDFKAVRLIFLLYFVLNVHLVNGQDQNSKFKHLTISDGLSQSTVSAIHKDQNGYMWFGTEDGLNKYDGHSFTAYKFDPENSNSISSSYITAIVEKGAGFLWIGTKNGLNLFDPVNEKFTRFVNNPLDPNGISDNHIISLAIGHDGQLIIGTANGINFLKEDGGFIKYFPIQTNLPYSEVSTIQDKDGNWWVLSLGRLEKLKFKEGKIERLSSFLLENTTSRAMYLSDSVLWIGNSNTLLKYDITSNQLSKFPFTNKVTLGYSKLDVLSILEDKNKEHLWLGTLQAGLLKFNKKTDTFTSIYYDPAIPHGINSNAIDDIFLDESNILWLGSIGGGINKYDPDQFKFDHFKNYPNNKNSLSDNNIRSILLDRDGELWVGTHGGLNRINFKSNEYTVYEHHADDPRSISSNTVRSLKEDVDGNIWAGTWDDGLNSFNKKTGIFKKYRHQYTPNQIKDQVPTMAIDKDLTIWVGGYGLKKFDPIKKVFQEIALNDNELIQGNVIKNLFIDDDGMLWIGTTKKGLYALDTKTDQVVKYPYRPNDSLSISHPYITSITEDQNGQIWVGTYGGGLNSLDKKSGIIKQFNIRNGLKNDVIYGILVDDEGFIWFTSNAGLARMDPNGQGFNYFSVDQGIQSNEFNAGAFYRGRDGAFYFGGINGFNRFYPRDIYSSEKIGEIVLTGIRVFERQQPVMTHKILDKHISYTNEVVLAHNQNTLILEFAELNYDENIDHNYEYQLGGLEETWRELGKKRSITLGALRPGNYELNIRVKGNSTHNSTIKIWVKNPFWKTKWAYLIYVLLLLLILILSYTTYKRFQNVRKQFELKIRNWEKGQNGNIELTQTAPANVFSPFQTEEMSVLNQRILERAIKIVEEHLDDSSFDVDRFKNEMYMSRSQLHRKLTSLTGYSTTKFIRLIRLNKAAGMLKTQSESITEIAYAVGFEHIGYFSKCFKETFDVSPSDFRS